jgi:hypothetical protein
MTYANSFQDFLFENYPEARLLRLKMLRARRSIFTFLKSLNERKPCPSGIPSSWRMHSKSVLDPDPRTTSPSSDTVLNPLFLGVCRPETLPL